MGVEQITNCCMESESLKTEEGETETYVVRLEFERRGAILIPLKETSAFEIRKLMGRLRGATIDPEDLPDIMDDYLGEIHGLSSL